VFDPLVLEFVEGPINGAVGYVGGYE